MLPYLELPTLGPVNSFGVLVVLGVVFGTTAAYRHGERTGLDDRLVRRMTFICAVCGLLGAHLVDVLLYQPGWTSEDGAIWTLLDPGTTCEMTLTERMYLPVITKGLSLTLKHLLGKLLFMTRLHRFKNFRSCLRVRPVAAMHDFSGRPDYVMHIRQTAVCAMEGTVQVIHQDPALLGVKLSQSGSQVTLLTI